MSVVCILHVCCVYTPLSLFQFALLSLSILQTILQSSCTTASFVVVPVAVADVDNASICFCWSVDASFGRGCL